MPKDPTRIPRFEALAPSGARLSPETLEAFRPSLPDSRPFLAQQAHVRLMAARRELASRRETLRQELAAAERALEVRKLEAAREIAALEERLREAEERCGITRPVTPAPRAHPAEHDGPQTSLVRQFFQEEHRGRPPEKFGHRKLCGDMKTWVEGKNATDGGSRRGASETTIRDVLKTY